MHTIITSLLSLIFSFVIYYFYKHIIKPYLGLSFYKKQGIHTDHFIRQNAFDRDLQNAEEHGDYAYYWKQLAKQSPKPKAFAFNIQSEISLYLIDSQLIKEFVQKHENYIKYPAMLELHKEAIGTGISLSEGEEWKRHRKICSMAFHNELLRKMIPEIQGIADEFLNRLKSENKLKSMDVMNEFQAITGEVVGRLFFGEKFSTFKIDEKPITVFLAELIGRIGVELYNTSFQLFGKRIVKSGIFKEHRELMAAIEQFRSFCKDRISKKISEFEAQGSSSDLQGKNMVEMFYLMRKSSPENAFTDDEIVNQFGTFFLAGMDSTGHLISMASYYYLTESSCQEKILNEVNRVIKGDQQVNAEDLNGMDYMTAFLKETLRMATPSIEILDRVALRDHTLGEYKVKKGTIVNLALVCNHFDEKYFEDPEIFKPARWIDSETRTMKSVKADPFVFIPFSTGAHNCIGQHMAMNEAKIILSLFIKKFRYVHTNKEYKMKFIQRFLYEPLDELRYDLECKDE